MSYAKVKGILKDKVGYLENMKMSADRNKDAKTLASLENEVDTLNEVLVMLDSLGQLGPRE